EILQNHKKITDERRALARLVDNDFSWNRLDFLDDTPAHRSTNQQRPNAAFRLLADAHRILADDLAAKNFVVWTIAEIGNVTLAAMDDRNSSGTKIPESSGGVR